MTPRYVKHTAPPTHPPQHRALWGYGDTRERLEHAMPDEETPVIAPVAPAAPEPAAPAESTTISKSEHDAAMAKLRIEGKDGRAALARLAEIEAANLTAQEKADKRAADAEARATAAEADRDAVKLDALKASIGAELGIPASLRSRLTGTTEEEVRADAVSVAAELKIEPAKAKVGGGGRPADASEGEDAFIAILNAP